MRLLTIATLLLSLPAAAEVTIEWVTVGDPGNACDTQSQGCFGAVSYEYQISKFEVTNAQYTEFLNAVAETDTNALYSTLMGSGFGGITRIGSSGSFTYSAIAGRLDMPVNFVTFYDSLRFANWLHNGQLMGAQDNTTTEDGAYTITSAGITANSITRNAGAAIFLTSEDEWYKAAYHDAASTSYFDYPPAFDTQTTCALPGATPNTANCQNSVGDLTNVGSYTGAASPNGTFDQGGNVWELNEAIISGSFRGLRGGRFNGGGSWELAASLRTFDDPANEGVGQGFRVARLAPVSHVPSLSPFGIAILWSLLSYAGWRRGRFALRGSKERASRFKKTGGVLVAILGMMALLPGWAHAGSFVISPILDDGDTAPGTGGLTYASFGRSALNDSDVVAFSASVSGGPSDAIFVVAGGIDRAVALSGGPAPGTGGGVFTGVGFPFVNDPGDVSFIGVTSTIRGVFVDSSGILSPIALEGDTAPGGGTYTGFSTFSGSINDSGEVAFRGSFTSPNGGGIFVDSGGIDRSVARTGDPAPGTGGGSYSSLGNSPSVNDSGDVAFLAQVSGGTIGEGIFLESGGVDSAISVIGDPAPDTGGGTYSDLGINPLSGPSLNNSGDVAFQALVAGGTTAEGIFVNSGGVDRAVALLGGPAPDTGGGTFDAFFHVALNSKGDVVFSASVAGGAVPVGIFVHSGGTVSAVVLAGDPAPGTGGGTLSSSQFSFNDSGEVVFGAVISGSAVLRGLFLATPFRPVPLLPGAGLVVLTLSLFTVGAYVLVRRR